MDHGIIPRWLAPKPATCALIAALALPAGLAAQSAPPPAGPAQAGQSLTLAFRYAKGNHFRVLSEINEEVLANGRLLSRSTISNRISFEVAEVEGGAGAGAESPTRGLLRGTFLTEEVPEGSSIPLVSASYDSEFWRDTKGLYTIAPTMYMPVVRNCPVFPERPVKPGDTWTAPGEERHDLRAAFGIEEPYAIPFTASYRYDGPLAEGGKELSLLGCSYTIFAQPAPPRTWKAAYPIQIAGYSDQRIKWDNAMGEISSYEERFKLVLDLSDGSRLEYRGTAKATVVEAVIMDRAKVRDEIEDSVAALPNVSVRQDELGVTISMEDIRFQPDSAILLPEELAKIDRIAAVLARYPDRDFLVAGHTALAGSAEGRRKLSEERAQAVAKALAEAMGKLGTQAGAKPVEARFHTVGWGAEKPVADNATVEGMAKNRRVEITILEN